MPRLTRPCRQTIPGPVTGGRRPDKPPLRPRDMKDSKSRKRRSRGMRADSIGRDESPAELIAGYTPKQREVYLRGLRILAKVIDTLGPLGSAWRTPGDWESPQALPPQ